jgi:DnaJ-domain-containing protein 1
MSESRDYLEMAYRSIECFSNDGVLKPDELKSIVAIALRDGVVDENEKRVLRSILAKLKPVDLTEEMLIAVGQLRQQLDL